MMRSRVGQEGPVRCIHFSVYLYLARRRITSTMQFCNSYIEFVFCFFNSGIRIINIRRHLLIRAFVNGIYLYFLKVVRDVELSEC